jgi:predicted outer membrane repeat protein
MKQLLQKSILCIAMAILCLSVTTRAQYSINFSGNSGNGAAANYGLDLTNGFTIEYETYLDNIVNYNAGVTSTSGNEPEPIDTYVDQNGNFNILFGNGNNNASVSIPNFVSGQWYNIAITFNANNDSVYVYVNGIQQAAFTSGAVSSVGSIMIGNRGDNATFANAGFDRVLIWSGGARSAAQVKADQYTCFTGSETGLDVYYKMGEDAGTTLNNSGGAGSAANATITGPVTWTGGSDSCTIAATAINTYYSPSGKHKWTTSGYHIDTMACGTIVYVNLALTHLMYVSSKGSGANGMSWSSAYTNFANAVDSSKAGDTILVAMGTYQPASGTSFTMKDSVKIYGGFAGTETGLSQRNLPGGYAAVLKGNGAAVIDNTSNNLTNAAVLDGFVITSGTCGMNNISSSPILSNLIFTTNNNSSAGGGMANGTSSAPVLTNVLFYGNTSIIGGGMFNNSSSPILTNVVFSNNTTSSSGGAIYNTHSSSTITNVTFSNNSAGTGGAIFNDSPIATTITNAIFWGNTDGSGFPDYGSHAGAPAVITYCYTQTSITGTGNIMGSQDPFVSDASTGAVKGADSTWMTADDGLHLVTGSAAIGAGNVSAVPAGITTDITGVNTIIQSGKVNMGAYANTCQTESFLKASACNSYNSPSGKYTWSTSGLYTDTIPNHATCDSVIHVNLTVNYPTTTDTNATVCNYIKWYGDSITQTGTYTYTLTAKITGCDSTMQLAATVNHSSASAINIGTYASTYKFKGSTETTSGHYAFDTTGASGCDSIVNLYLTLYAAPTISGGGCIPANLIFSGSPTPALIQWQNGGVTVVTDTAKWNAGNVVAQDRIDGNAYSVAIDTAGNVYVGDQSQVFKYPKGATTGTPGVTVAQNGISNIEDIKVDIAGNLFVEDGSNKEVYEFPVGSDSTTVPKVVASHFRDPEYLFVDNADNIYVSDNDNEVVWYYPAGNTKGTIVAQKGINEPGGLYVDNSGNLFVSDFGNNDVLEYTKGSTSSTNASIVAADELGNAHYLGNVTVDGNGYIYVESAIQNNTGNDSSVIYIYSPGSGASTHPADSIILPGMLSSYDFATDASGNVYAMSNGNGTVEKYSNIIKMTDSVKTGGSYTAMVNSFSGSSTTTNAILVGPHPTIHVAGQDSIMLGSVDTLIASGTATSYLWSPSGQSTDSIKVSPGSNTTYMVIATLGDCSDTATFTVKIEILTGIKTISTQGSVRAYPNPAIQTLNLTFSSGNDQDATIDVVDLAGQVVISKNTTISNGEIMPIDISRLAVGNYMVKIKTASSSQTLKFVKQ